LHNHDIVTVYTFSYNSVQYISCLTYYLWYLHQVLIADILSLFHVFRIGFTITGRNYSDELQDVSSREYKTTAAEIFARVSWFEAMF